MIAQLFNAEVALSDLMQQTIQLVRTSQDVKTMKQYLYCYDILGLTADINKPWDDHPGFVYGDLGAFMDLGHTCKEILLKLDPDPYSVRSYVVACTRLMIYWQTAMNNRQRAINNRLRIVIANTTNKL